MATMQEIAELAGVSRGTVDRVLNNRGGVNDATKEKILDISKLLNYEPNRAGIALAAQKKNIKIGVLIYGSGNPFFTEIKRGIDKRMQDLIIYGCELIFRQTRFDVKEMLSALDELASLDITGLLITAFDDDRIREKVRILTDKGIPVVTMNTDINDCGRLAYVGGDSYKGGQTAGALMGLLTNGKAEVGIITGTRSIRGQEERIRGFRELAQKKYPNIHIEAIEECHDDDYKSYETVQRMLLEYPTIDAFFFPAGSIYGGCKALHQMTTRKKYTVITFDDSEVTRDFMRKDIITAIISQHPYLIGYRSLSTISNYILFNQLPESEQNMTDTTIMIKESL